MTTSADTLAPPRKKRMSLGRREAIFFYIFIAPWLIGLLVFTVGPIIASLYYSFSDYAIVAAPDFIGLANYIRAFTKDRLFWKSLGNTFYYVGIGVPLRVIFAFLLASLLNADIKGRLFYRIAYYVPSIIPGVASAVLWIILLNPKLGMVNLILGLFGVPTINWLGNPAWSKPAMILMSLWGVGGSMVIYLAGLQGIPDLSVRGRRHRRRRSLGQVLERDHPPDDTHDPVQPGHPDHRLVPGLRQRLHHDPAVAR